MNLKELETHLSIAFQDIHQVASINRTLIQNNLDVYLLHPKENDLEQLFIDLTLLTIMNLLISLGSEALKTKRTASFYLTMIAAVFGPCMSLFDLFWRGHVGNENGKVIFPK